jgi:hypothetical protein
VTKFCTVVFNICGLSVWNLFHVTLLAPRILSWLLYVWKIFALCQSQDARTLHLYDAQQHTEKCNMSGTRHRIFILKPNVSWSPDDWKEIPSCNQWSARSVNRNNCDKVHTYNIYTGNYFYFYSLVDPSLYQCISSITIHCNYNHSDQGTIHENLIQLHVCQYLGYLCWYPTFCKKVVS